MSKDHGHKDHAPKDHAPKDRAPKDANAGREPSGDQAGAEAGASTDDDASGSGGEQGAALGGFYEALLRGDPGEILVAYEHTFGREPDAEATARILNPSFSDVLARERELQLHGRDTEGTAQGDLMGHMIADYRKAILDRDADAFERLQGHEGLTDVARAQFLAPDGSQLLGDARMSELLGFDVFGQAGGPATKLGSMVNGLAVGTGVGTGTESGTDGSSGGDGGGSGGGAADVDRTLGDGGGTGGGTGDGTGSGTGSAAGNGEGTGTGGTTAPGAVNPDGTSTSPTDVADSLGKWLDENVGDASGSGGASTGTDAGTPSSLAEDPLVEPDSSEWGGPGVSTEDDVNGRPATVTDTGDGNSSVEYHDTNTVQFVFANGTSTDEIPLGDSSDQAGGTSPSDSSTGSGGGDDEGDDDDDEDDDEDEDEDDGKDDEDDDEEGLTPFESDETDLDLDAAIARAEVGQSGNRTPTNDPEGGGALGPIDLGAGTGPDPGVIDPLDNDEGFVAHAPKVGPRPEFGPEGGETLFDPLTGPVPVGPSVDPRAATAGEAAGSSPISIDAGASGSDEYGEDGPDTGFGAGHDEPAEFGFSSGAEV